MIQHHLERAQWQLVRKNSLTFTKKDVWDTIREAMQAVLRMGVIEESKSVWRSPIVLNPKVDGMVLFCRDVHKLKSITKFDASPVPRVDEL